MVTFSLGTNSKRAANGSTARRIVMQMVPEGLPGPAAGRWHARRGKLCHSPLSPLNSINGKSHVSLRRRKQVKTPAEGWRWRGGTWAPRGRSGTRRAVPGASGCWLGRSLTAAEPGPGGCQECPSFRSRGVPAPGTPTRHAHREFGQGDTRPKRRFHPSTRFCLQPAQPRRGSLCPHSHRAGSRRFQRGRSREQRPAGLCPCPMTPLPTRAVTPPGWQRCPFSLSTASRQSQLLLSLHPPAPGTGCTKGPGSGSLDLGITPAGMSLEPSAFPAKHRCHPLGIPTPAPASLGSRPSKHSPCWKTNPYHPSRLQVLNNEGISSLRDQQLQRDPRPLRISMPWKYHQQKGKSLIWVPWLNAAIEKEQTESLCQGVFYKVRALWDIFSRGVRRPTTQTSQGSSVLSPRATGTKVKKSIPGNRQQPRPKPS